MKGCVRRPGTLCSCPTTPLPITHSHPHSRRRRRRPGYGDARCPPAIPDNAPSRPVPPRPLPASVRRQWRCSLPPARRLLAGRLLAAATGSVTSWAATSGSPPPARGEAALACCSPRRPHQRLFAGGRRRRPEGRPRREDKVGNHNGSGGRRRGRGLNPHGRRRRQCADVCVRRRYSRPRLLRDRRWASPRPHATKAETLSPPPRRRRYTMKDAATADREALGVPAMLEIVVKGDAVDVGGAVAAVILDLGTAASPQPLCGSASLRHPAGGLF
ncbi:hypothetical protein BU14_0316s0014 [Porphyra umbilicalis]|uniref:Uncharacterized protein n=1 Tax=Porphyra umbilicalis TaxID=2786 RepID=A0A1X6NZN5_PORUM|nr:hypothetical protein BU14_0316s0014 [Porphyra umbilicalis]|eukprot:OSX73986.1 hypothetical protein BU14_0316s0014 [Porphyra umbilicalis]